MGSYALMNACESCRIYRSSVDHQHLEDFCILLLQVISLVGGEFGSMEALLFNGALLHGVLPSLGQPEACGKWLTLCAYINSRM